MKAISTHPYRRILVIAATLTLATCALLAIVSWLPGGSTRSALASGVATGSITHTLLSDFNVCSVPTVTLNPIFTNTVVANTGGGEIRLVAYLEDYFDGTQLDATKWMSAPIGGGSSTAMVGGGLITIDQASVRSIPTVPTLGRDIEIRARFAISVGNGDIGFGRKNRPGAPPLSVTCPISDPIDCNGASRLFITIGGNNAVQAYGRDGFEPSGGPTSTVIAGLTYTEFHRYRIDWNDNQAYYSIDGVLYPAATFTSASPSTYTPYVWLFTEHYAPPRPLVVDWLRVNDYPTTGQYQSCAMASPLTDTNWTTLTWTSGLPTGTGAAFKTRSSADGVTWSAWAQAGGSGSAIPSPNGQYLQYRITLSTTDANASPEISSVSAGYELNEPPSANAGGPYTTSEGASLIVSGALSMDPNGDPLNYAWDLNNDGVFTDAAGITATVIFPDGPDTRIIALRVSDESSVTGTQTTTVTINNVAPTVNTPNLTPPSPAEGSAVSARATFSDPAGSLDAPFTCAVNYGDSTGNFAGTVFGATCTGPVHIYTENGAYTVTVSVIDNDSGVGSKSASHTVTNAAPTISSVSNSGPVVEGLSATITIAASDPAGANDPLNYAFDCNNDFVYEVGPQPGSATACAFGDNGSFTVNVRVTDDDGGSTNGSTTVAVNNAAPSVSTTGPYSGAEGSPIAFTGNTTDVPSDTHTYLWRFGDGGASTLRTPMHAYADNGLYTAVFTATDDDGGFNVISTIVTIGNVAPIMHIGPDRSANEGSPVSFSATVIDPGSADTFTYLWNFGDGVTSTLAAPSHAYADNGIFTATLTLFDDDGGGPATDQAIVTINNVAPSVSTTGPYTGAVGGPVAFTGNFIDPGSADTHTFLWHFGDGVTSPLRTPAHTYTNSGVYTAIFTTLDDDGGFNVVSTTVTVKYVTRLPLVARHAGSASGSIQPLAPKFLTRWANRIQGRVGGDSSRR